jgi:soluble lytic murein transglycosylase-like protein
MRFTTTETASYELPGCGSRRIRTRATARRRRRIVLRPAGRRCLAAAAAASVIILNGVAARMLGSEPARPAGSAAAANPFGAGPILRTIPVHVSIAGDGAAAAQSRAVSLRTDTALLPARGGFERVPVYARYVSDSNPDLADVRAHLIATLILDSSDRYGVDPRLVTAMIEIESGFRPGLVSSAGAVGLCQLMPRTARSLKLGDPRALRMNVDGSVRYLSSRLAAFHGRTHLALAAYNAGETAVRRYHGVPPYRETLRYVHRVMRLYRRLCRGPRHSARMLSAEAFERKRRPPHRSTRRASVARVRVGFSKVG